MRVAIAGAGAVGRSIAGELLENGHEVLLVDKAPTAISVERVPQAEWLLADACGSRPWTRRRCSAATW